MYESPGLTRPSWMDDDEWSEYMMSEEARVELTREDDYYESGMYDEDYDDYLGDAAEAEAEYYYELGQNAYYDGEELYGNEPYWFEEGWKSAMLEVEARER